ncbi:MAG TPA: DUF4276 family protein [bacterium]|nr:DUF4276 family protein [bacterium]
MIARLQFIVEGQTEEAFVEQVLIPHLWSRSVYGVVGGVETSRKLGKKQSGGITRYVQAKKHICNWMSEDQNRNAFFTTMFDLYALPTDFPNYGQARKQSDPYQRVKMLEDALSRDAGNRRLIPYIQLHEFEALLLAEPQKLDWQFINHEKAIGNLVQMVSEFDSPEMIDDDEETAPSKRIIQEIPEYKGRKESAGPLVAAKIGLDTLRSKCPHFNEWLNKIERLGEGASA